MKHNNLALAKYAHAALSMLVPTLPPPIPWVSWDDPRDMLEFKRYDVFADRIDYSRIKQEKHLAVGHYGDVCTFPGLSVCVGAVSLRQAIESAVAVAAPGWRRYALGIAQRTPLADVFKDAVELYAAVASVLARKAPFGVWLRLALRPWGVSETTREWLRSLL